MVDLLQLMSDLGGLITFAMLIFLLFWVLIGAMSNHKNLKEQLKEEKEMEDLVRSVEESNDESE